MRFTLDDLASAVYAAAGGIDGLETIDERTVDVEFDELGYDSLVLLEFLSHLKRVHGLDLPDDAVGDLRSPRQALLYINSRLDDRAVA